MSKLLGSDVVLFLANGEGYQKGDLIWGFISIYLRIQHGDIHSSHLRLYESMTKGNYIRKNEKNHILKTAPFIAFQRLKIS